MRAPALVCVGAGRGRRFGGDKVAAPLAGRTVLEVSLAALVAAFPSAPLAVVVAPERVREWSRRLGAAFASALVVAGGKRRQDSVRAGVEAVAGEAETVLVHDAARPAVAPQDVRRVAAALGHADGAVLVAPVADTVKRVTPEGRVTGTVDRTSLRLALTPQGFRLAALVRAWAAVDWSREWTDEAAMLEAAGLEVVAVEATRPNPKVTSAADLELVAALVEGRR